MPEPTSFLTPWWWCGITGTMCSRKKYGVDTDDREWIRHNCITLDHYDFPYQNLPIIGRYTVVYYDLRQKERPINLEEMFAINQDVSAGEVYQKMDALTKEIRRGICHSAHESDDL